MNAMLMPYPGYSKNTASREIQIYDFSHSLNFSGSDALHGFIYIYIVLPVKFMHCCASYVSYEYFGNVNFVFLNFCVFKRTGLQKSPLKIAAQRL